jgi:hypothetical protein
MKSTLNFFLLKFSVLLIASFMYAFIIMASNYNVANVRKSIENSKEMLGQAKVKGFQTLSKKFKICGPKKSSPKF